MGQRARHGKWSDKEVFTTGQAAEICGVSQQTIIRCFDSGRLSGFRVPGSKFRRIPRAELLRFMKVNGIPLTALNGGHRRVLLVSSDSATCDAIARAMAGDDRLELRMASTPYEAGFLTEQLAPHLIVVDADMPQLDPRAVIQRVRSSPELSDARVMVIGSLRPDAADQFGSLGAVAAVRKPIDAKAAVARIAELVM